MTDDLDTRLRTQLSDVANSLRVDVSPTLDYQRSPKRLMAAAIGTLILVLAGGIAWSRLSGNNNHVTNPAPSLTTTSRIATTTTVSPSSVVASLGPCPQLEPTGAPSTLNAGVNVWVPNIRPGRLSRRFALA